MLRRQSSNGLAAAVRKPGTMRFVPAREWPQSDQYSLIQPQINSKGIHVWPFDAGLPVDLRFLTSDGRNTVQQNRHEYFEVFVVWSGATTFLVQDRLLPMNEGDLAVVGNSLYHSVGNPSNSRTTIATLYFDPGLIRNDGIANSADYLAPFLQQDARFPHVLSMKTGVPGQVFDFMRMIRAELPGSSVRGRLAVKTYLKMILMLLVNQYSSYAGTVEAIRCQQCALDRLHNFFDFLPTHLGDPIQVSDAARLCHLTDSEFMHFFLKVTGQSFKGFLNQRRVEHAQTALSGTNRPIADIALEMGFCDQSYFGAVFRKLVGLAPAAYRRRMRAPADQSGPTADLGCLGETRHRSTALDDGRI